MCFSLGNWLLGWWCSRCHERSSGNTSLTKRWVGQSDILDPQFLKIADGHLPKILPMWPFPPFQRSFLNTTTWPSFKDSECSGNKPAEAFEHLLSCFLEWHDLEGHVFLVAQKWFTAVCLIVSSIYFIIFFKGCRNYRDKFIPRQ